MSLHDRREFLRGVAAFAAATSSAGRLLAADRKRESLPIAAVVTEYRENTHADVIVGKVLAGFDQRGGPGPDLHLAAMYVDQFPAGDLSRDLAAKHGFRLAKSIDEALTLGTERLQVAGVLSIGEHGDYPADKETGQVMYPRRRFFDGIVETFRRTGQTAPVFNDKHLAYAWSDAKAMFDAAVELKIPLMAGSSVPVGWRRPPLNLPRDCDLDGALAVGYGGLEAYGFHTIELLQCMVERRKGGETGVKAIRVLRGDEIAHAGERGEWSPELLAAALATMPGSPQSDLSKLNADAAFYLIEYRDGLKAAVAMANGLASQFGFAAKIRGEPRPVATWVELEEDKPFGHFGFLLKAIEEMIHTGRPSYPVERTLLSTGVLDAVMHSLKSANRRETPQLDIRYQPVDWPYANAP